MGRAKDGRNGAESCHRRVLYKTIRFGRRRRSDNGISAPAAKTFDQRLPSFPAWTLVIRTPFAMLPIDACRIRTSVLCVVGSSKRSSRLDASAWRRDVDFRSLSSSFPSGISAFVYLRWRARGPGRRCLVIVATHFLALFVSLVRVLLPETHLLGKNDPLTNHPNFFPLRSPAGLLQPKQFLLHLPCHHGYLLLVHRHWILRGSSISIHRQRVQSSLHHRIHLVATWNVSIEQQWLVDAFPVRC